MNSGVYLIRNKSNGKVYVGSAAISLSFRIGQHRKALRLGKHNNKHLQSSWDLYGEGAFEFVVVCKCLPANCTKHEQKWIDRYKSYDKRFGYNKSPTAGSPLGVRHKGQALINIQNGQLRISPEERRNRALRAVETRRKNGYIQPKSTRKKRSLLMKKRWKDPKFKEEMVKKLTGKVRSEETNLKHSLAMLGRKPTKAAKRKMRLAKLGKKQSQETIKKRTAKLIGVKRPPDVIARIRASNLGLKRSKASRLKFSIAQRKRFEDPEQRRLAGVSNLGRKKTPEQMTRLLEKVRDPEFRKLQSIKAKRAWKRIKRNASN